MDSFFPFVDSCKHADEAQQLQQLIRGSSRLAPGEVPHEALEPRQSLTDRYGTRVAAEAEDDVRARWWSKQALTIVARQSWRRMSHQGLVGLGLSAVGEAGRLPTGPRAQGRDRARCWGGGAGGGPPAGASRSIAGPVASSSCRISRIRTPWSISGSPLSC